MAVSEAQKRASNKYNSKHMATLGSKVKKAEAQKFKEYAKRKKEIIKNYAQAKGESVNSFINRAVDEAIDNDNLKRSVTFQTNKYPDLGIFFI